MADVTIPNISRSDLGITLDGNIGGLSKNIFLIRADALASEPAITAPAVKVDAAEDFTFVDDLTEVFATIYHTKDTGVARFESQGEYDSKSFKQFLEFAIPTNNEKALQVARNFLNEDIVCVAKDRNKQLVQIGTIDSPANCEEVSGGTGKTGTEARNVTFVLTAENIIPLIILESAPQTVVTPGP
ncbi:hypothetical protein [Flammeovirga aprica]|uniref:Uncharacterized protein n=1 Tax=Flammeovirga aprica JL-4 TaxID=694437 RepID=A0A7X9P2G4_9BACT|nr:hypothetical protein [Flammeovirga aprica]NME67197.1 hypothetical protein [Flammeovirga aprica JL-4]